MGRVLCFIGVHSWQRQHNPEASGPGADFQTCSRCGKEKADYGKPPSSGVARG